MVNRPSVLLAGQFADDLSGFAGTFKFKDARLCRRPLGECSTSFGLTIGNS
jgi:hypothetical protein